MYNNSCYTASLYTGPEFQDWRAAQGVWVEWYDTTSLFIHGINFSSVYLDNDLNNE